MNDEVKLKSTLCALKYSIFTEGTLEYKIMPQICIYIYIYNYVWFNVFICI